MVCNSAPGDDLSDSGYGEYTLELFLADSCSLPWHAHIRHLLGILCIRWGVGLQDLQGPLHLRAILILMLSLK